MKKPVKLLIFLGLIAGLTLGLLGCQRHYLDRQKIVALAERQVEAVFKQPVEISSTSFEPFKGPRITMRGIVIGKPGTLLVEADSLKVRIKPFRFLITGKVELSSITLNRPRVELPYEYLRTIPWQTGGSRPRVHINDGSLKLIYHGRAYQMQAVSVYCGPHEFFLNAQALGGTAKARIARIRKLWRGSISLKGLRPPELPEQYRGYLPLDIEIAGHGNSQKAVLSSLAIASPRIKLDGSASIRDFKGDPAISFALKSQNFDYQRLIDPLPIPEPFLNQLFKAYIRDGRCSFEHIRFNGRLSAMRDPLRFFELTDLKLLLDGQSFGAGFDNERIRNIHGSFTMRGGDLYFERLHGSIGQSTIQRVDLFFKAPAKPGFRIDVNVATAIRAADFVKTWRAVMTDRDLHDAFAGFSQVSSGNLNGQVRTTYDGARKSMPTRINGTLNLDRVSLVWNDLHFSDVSGAATSRRPIDPVNFKLQGDFEDLNVKSFELNIDDFSPNANYAFAGLAVDLPDLERLAFDPASTLTLKGQGHGALYSGTAAIKANQLQYGQARLKALSGRSLTASGPISGQLAPEFYLKLNAARIADSSLTLAGGFGSASGALLLKGALDLDRFNLTLAQDQNLTAPRGRLTPAVNIAWGNGAGRVTGALDLDKIELRNPKPLGLLDGQLLLKPGLITTPGLNIHTPETDIDLTGRLLTEAKKIEGAATLKGYEIKAGEPLASVALPLPTDYNASLSLKLKDLSLYGLQLRHGSGQLDYAGGNATLRNLKLRGDGLSLNGTLRLNRKQDPVYDFKASIRSLDISNALANFTQKKPLTRGKADLDGQFWGSGKSLNGEARFVIRDGKVLRYGTLAKVFGALNFYKMIKNGRLAVSEDGFPFNSMSGSFKLQRNVASFDDLRLDSNSVQLSAVGSYDIDKETVEAVLGLQPLETVDRTVGSIPVLGWILTGPEKGLLVFSFHVSGPLDNPLVLPAPVNTLSKPVFGAIQRTLMLPVDLVRSPQKVLLPGSSESPRQSQKAARSKPRQR